MELNIYKKMYKLQTSGWWFGNCRNKLVMSLLNKYIENFKKCKLLDVGCSEGAFLDYLNDSNMDFCGIDIDENAIKFCKKRGYNKQVKYGDILNIPFESETFDVITLLDIVEHVEDDRRALIEVKRVCAGGGQFYLLFLLTNGYGAAMMLLIIIREDIVKRQFKNFLK